MRGQPFDIFALGAPTQTAPDGTFYFDTTTAPFVQYVRQGGAWVAVGGGGGSGPYVPYTYANYNWYTEVPYFGMNPGSYGGNWYIYASRTGYYGSLIKIEADAGIGGDGGYIEIVANDHLNLKSYDNKVVVYAGYTSLYGFAALNLQAPNGPINALSASIELNSAVIKSALLPAVAGVAGTWYVDPITNAISVSP